MLEVIPLVAQPCNHTDDPPLWSTLNRYDASREYENARGRLFAAVGMTTAKRAGFTPPYSPWIFP
jgi:hypothetical protein